VATPPYSIVVVTWQCAGYLAELVRTMNEHLDGTQELVVVDNASEDHPAEAAKRWKGPVEFIQTGENLGFGVGSNVGTAKARGPAVVLLNPDTELRDNGLDRLAAMVLERRVLGGPRMLNPDGTEQASASGPEVGAWPWIRAVLPGALTPGAIVARTEPWRVEHDVQVSWITGACVAGPTDVLRKLGPFDPALHMYGEDLDLGLRAADAGIPSIFSPGSAEIVHHGGGSSSLTYGTAEGWKPMGAIQWRAVLRRTYGGRREARAWRALRLNLALRVWAKRALRWNHASDEASRGAIVSATDVPELPPAPAYGG
jgi:GT2 family glycosyltransferase